MQSGYHHHLEIQRSIVDHLFQHEEVLQLVNVGRCQKLLSMKTVEISDHKLAVQDKEELDDGPFEGSEAFRYRSFQYGADQNQSTPIHGMGHVCSEI